VNIQGLIQARENCGARLSANDFTSFFFNDRGWKKKVRKSWRL